MNALPTARIARALAVALLTALVVALGTTTAVAQTQGHFSADGPVTLQASQTGAASANAWKLFGGTTECTESTYTGHEAGSTTKPIPEEATQATLTPTHKSCTTDSGGSKFSTTIDMNGCDFDLDIGETDEAAHTYDLYADIACPEGKAIQVTLFSSGSHALRVCTMTITAASSSSFQIVSTTGDDDIDVQGALSGISAHKSGLCGAASEGEGEMTFDLTAEGRNAKGGATDIAVRDEPPELGFFSADGPVTLTLSGGTTTFTMFGGQLQCPGTTYTGHAIDTTPHGLIQPPAREATISPIYKGCTTTDSGGSKFSTTIDMNGCDFGLEVEEPIIAESSFGATTNVLCPEGKVVELTLFSSSSHALKVCTQKLTAPAGLPGGVLGNVKGESEDLDLEAEFGPFTLDKSGLCGAGEDKEAHINVDATVRGFNEAAEETGLTLVEEGA